MKIYISKYTLNILIGLSVFESCVWPRLVTKKSPNLE